MANHKSAAKRARQSLRRREVNKQVESAVRTIEKKLRKSITAKDKSTATTLLKEYTSSIAKAAQKGRLHDNKASRKISRLATSVNSL